MKKRQIAVFDFNNADCEHTANAVSEYFGSNALIFQFSVMQDFAFSFKEKSTNGEPYEMVFIGVDNMLGVETARNIREIDEKCPIFFVSKVSDFGIEGFRLCALDYLIKPVSVKRVGRAVVRIGTGPDKNLLI